MARTASEIEAEIEALRASGVDLRTAKAKALREELKAVKDGEAPATPQTETMTEAEPMTVDVDAGVNLYDSDEWRFIEKACAEVNIEPDGTMSNIVKKVFNVLWAKVLVWRITREIVAQVGIGNEWPQWSALGRDPSTGQRVAAKLPPVRALPPEPVAPVVTEGGMPIRPVAPASELDALKAAIKNTVSGQISARPDILKAPTSATA